MEHKPEGYGRLDIATLLAVAGAVIGFAFWCGSLQKPVNILEALEPSLTARANKAEERFSEANRTLKDDLHNRSLGTM